MKMKLEIEKKIERDGEKSEKETTISFDDVPDVKKAAKKVGAFLAKVAKETAGIATDIVGEITYNVAATTANALESVVDTAEMAVNSIDRFIDEKFEVVEEIDEEICDGQCCGNCCCGETCEDEEELADTIDDLIDELENEDDEADEDVVEDDVESDSAEEVSEDDSSDEPEEDPVEAFIKGVIGDVEKISTDIISFIKADDKVKSEKLKEFEGDFKNTAEKISNHFRKKYLSEDEIDNSSDNPIEEVITKNAKKEKKVEIPEGSKFTLAEYLDYLGVYKCEEKTVNTEKEACIFFAAIGYPASYISRVAFETSATLEHINYNSVSGKIIEYIPNMKKEQIVAALKSDFDKWLETREDICKYCPKPEFRFLLKYFVKKVRGC